ncbi:MAG TPA: cytochrome c oxidase subunit 4 [Mycobacteriales bacterium]|jgi:hypothetical protein|nr:cytochrome c oxidase subunit 4 [Mycobacteriales bacterium]
MKLESRIFNGLALFLFIMATVYYIWTDHSVERADWIGTTALVLSGGLCGLCGMYFSFVARRIEPRPEDRDDAEIDEGAGELGFFSPGSYWPVGIALSVVIAGFGAIYWAPWLLVVGGIAIIGSVGGLLFEYYTGSRASH